MKKYLKETIHYSNDIFLFGNYFRDGKHLTEINEINEIIKEIKEENGINISYHNIGCLKNEEKVELFDKIILRTNQKRTGETMIIENEEKSKSFCSLF